jgi:hypothetical protein
MRVLDRYEQGVNALSDLVLRTISILRGNGERWRGLAALDRDLFARSPAPGEWSALQCLGHATDTEANVFGARINAVLSGQAEVPNFDPDTQSTPITASTDPAALAGRHSALRAKNLELLGTVGHADLQRTSRHAQLGVFTLHQLISEWAAHDLMHVVQAERAVMQAFIPDSGPWRYNFVDHDVDVKRKATD